ncbi:cytochrome P450 [Biscogniauxia sp. FL1348]|nr:cytochrome P450 [Biscogniauxia sp. FL1348]
MISKLATCIAFLAYPIILGIYRLYFHPLAKVPGPWLGALTGWYEAYFELAHKGVGGQFTFHIRELHIKYGPIVRISPNEVHIDDPDFYSNIYNNRDNHDKPRHLKWRFGSPSTLFSTPEHHIHKMRRAAQDPFFAKGKILKFAPQIQRKVDKMCARLSDDFVDRGKPVTLNNMFTSYIADVTTQFAFDRDFGYLGDPNFDSPFVKAFRGFKNIAHPFGQFPWLARLMSCIPDPLVHILQPSMAAVLEFKDNLRCLIREAQEELSTGKDFHQQSPSDKTIIHGILNSNLSEDEMSMNVLQDQAVGLIGAGIASSQWTMVIAAFHIISDRDIYLKLKQELKTTIPDPNEPVSLDKELEKSPYLVACVEEAIRLACGQMARSPRISKTPVQYAGYSLPPGTHVALDTWHMHHHEGVYPSSFSFVPDRWLGGARAPAPFDSKPLKHYQTSFGKGTRNCLGMNLAYAEITIALAYLMRRFEWELWETSYEDVRVVRDLIAPDVRADSKGVRALVRKSSD